MASGESQQQLLLLLPLVVWNHDTNNVMATYLNRSKNILILSYSVLPQKQEAHLCAEVFSHAGLFNESSSSFFQTSSVVRQQPSGFNLCCYMGNLVLHPLEYKEHQKQHQNLLNQALSPQGVVKNPKSKYGSWPGSQRYVFQTAPSVWCKEQCDQSNPVPVQASETHTELEHRPAEFDILTEQILCFNLPVLLFQSYPRSTSRWHTYSHDRSLLKCSSLAPRTESRV